MVASCFQFWSVVCILVRASRLRFLFVCTSVLHLVAFSCILVIAYRDGVDGFKITFNDVFSR